MRLFGEVFNHCARVRIGNKILFYIDVQCLYLTEELPPQLTVHLASGHAAVGPSGEVLVYPGSIFHIDCLFDRRKGNPEWKTAKPGKRYPKGNNRNSADLHFITAHLAP